MSNFIISVTAVLFVLNSTTAFAQNSYQQDKDSNNRPGYIMNLHLGSLLPNQIKNVSEILPVWGGAYGYVKKRAIYELGFANGRAEGVEYTNANLSFRADFPIDDLLMSASIGPDIHFFKTPPSSDGTDSYMSGGGHLAGGFLAQIGGELWFKMEMKFNINPGTSLYLGFGFEYRSRASDDKDDEDEN